ncbi:helix-turn-helix domain-containing protein [Reichenbachiella ulvae]|uniref:Helix-turn-helix transcriptional regulator n=1 Tax=Reichenbachiella ulvae TaxID=2980104 RepID=A0ABT3CZM0_9BACT|nr:helix-turn-helix transcriptional regulator [Reichenbachiella ulvae]MCV9389087.1 helix-turn-helix transcriptional regulator [Reichenbachiella ulvae]
MLRLNISRVMRIRGIRNPYKFLRDQGISHAVVNRLLSGKSKGVKMDQLQRICLALHCTPNDLMEWDNAQSSLSDEHPIQELVRVDDNFSLEDLRKLPLEKLRELEEMLEGNSKINH